MVLLRTQESDRTAADVTQATLVSARTETLDWTAEGLAC
jgi:hypothetical protein